MNRNGSRGSVGRWRLWGVAVVVLLLSGGGMPLLGQAEAFSAVFGYDTRTRSLGTEVAPTGAGTVTVEPKKDGYAWRETVAVAVEPAVGYRFVNWELHAYGSANPLEVELEASGEWTIRARMEKQDAVVVESEAVCAAVEWDTRDYVLSVDTDPVGAGTMLREPDRASYAWGSEVTVTVESAVGFAFDLWMGAASGADPTAVVLLEGETAQTARARMVRTGGGIPDAVETVATGVFWDTRDFHIAAVAEPLASATVQRRPAKSAYAWREAVEVESVPVPGYEFVEWRGDGSGTEALIVVEPQGHTDWEVIAYQEKTTGLPDGTVSLTSGPVRWDTRNYRLETPVSPVGTATVLVQPVQEHYAWGSEVDVRVVPAMGWGFGGWDPETFGAEPAVTVTLDEAHLVWRLSAQMESTAAEPGDLVGQSSGAAGWDTRDYTLSVATNPVGAGTLEVVPEQEHYAWRETIQLTAHDSLMGSFVYWSGDLQSGDRTVILEPEGNLAWAVEAVYQLTGGPDAETESVGSGNWDTRDYSLTVAVNPDGGGSVTIDPEEAVYCWGQKVELRAEAANGFRLDRWESDRIGYATTFTQRMEEATHWLVTAYFEPGVEPAQAFEGWLVRHYGSVASAPQQVRKAGRMVSMEEAFLWGDDPQDPQDWMRVEARRGGGDVVEVAFPTLPNRYYRVLRSSDLSGGSWETVGTGFYGDGYRRTVAVEPLPWGKTFVQVEIQPSPSP